MREAERTGSPIGLTPFEETPFWAFVLLFRDNSSIGSPAPQVNGFGRTLRVRFLDTRILVRSNTRGTIASTFCLCDHIEAKEHDPTVLDSRQEYKLSVKRSTGTGHLFR
jgi:hypothetical protein